MLASSRFVDADQYDWCLPFQSLASIQYESPSEDLPARHLVPVERVMYLQVLAVGDRWVPLRQLLKIEVDPGEDYTFVVFAPAVGLGGVGDTLSQAVQSLSENIRAMWEELRDTPANELHFTAQTRLERLRAFILE